MVEISVAGCIDKPTFIYLMKRIPTLQNSKVRLKLFPYEHSDAQKSNLFASTDLVWLGYQKNPYSSSGVLIEAIEHQKPVILSCNSPIAKLISDSNAGYALDLSSDEEIFSLFESLTSAPIKHRTREPQFDFLLSQLQSRNFEDTISLLL